MYDILASIIYKQIVNMNNTTILDYFYAQVVKSPNKFALKFRDKEITYSELNILTNKIARYIKQKYKIKAEELVGLLFDQCEWMVIGPLAILKSGGAYLPIDQNLPYDRIKTILESSQAKALLFTKNNLYKANKLIWECSNLEGYLCVDSNNISDEIENPTILMDKSLWEYIGETSYDHISGGAWKSSFTGEYFSNEEMLEYEQNTYKKLQPYINNKTKVLEIGVATGITMFRIAKEVAQYVGTDISETIIKKNNDKIINEKLENIDLHVLAADEIDQLGPQKFDVIIINSVIQCFSGYNYFEKVLQKCANLLNDKGIIYCGDLMDLDLKERLIEDVEKFKLDNPEFQEKAKFDFSEELYINKKYLDYLQSKYSFIKDINISKKFHKLKNELTEYRFDAIISIDNKENSINTKLSKFKILDDIKEVEKINNIGKVIINTKSDTMAYVIYTSGSTGKPKGVVIEHKALINFCLWHNDRFEVNENDVTIKYNGFGFDASVWEIFPYLIVGAKIIVIPFEILYSPREINNFFEQEGVTICFLPTQFYQEFSKYDNKSLRILFTGGDKLNNYIPRDYILYNCYGPTENTILTTAYKITQSMDNIPIGTPVYNVGIVILDEDMKSLQQGEVGQICMYGDSLAREYLYNQEMTKKKFVLWDKKNKHIVEKRNTIERNKQNIVKLYLSGDLGRILEDGNIEFRGRLDFQVKIRGFRIELEEVESVLSKIITKYKIVVNAVDSKNGDKRIALYIVAKSDDINLVKLKKDLASKVPHYMVPSQYIFIDKLPINVNGKIDRKALPIPDSNTTKLSINKTNVKLPLTVIEKDLAKIWSNILNVDNIGIDSDFFELGGHSLKLVQLSTACEEHFKVYIPIYTLFKITTLQLQAKIIEQKLINSDNTLTRKITKAPEKTKYLASHGQKRLWLISKLDNAISAYNVPYAFDVKGIIDTDIFEKALQLVVKKYEILRTNFIEENGEIYQYIHKKRKINLNKKDCINRIQAEQYIRKIAYSNFDLEKDQLLRFEIVTYGTNKQMLFFSIHHIIFDGWSLGIIMQELSDAYISILNNEVYDLTKILQYKDFAEWHENLIKNNEYIEDKEYWIKQFSDELPILDLTTDFERPNIQKFQGKTIRRGLNKVNLQLLKDIANKNNTTVFIVIKSIFYLLFHKFTAQNDIVLGTVAAGRDYSDLKEEIGFFVNTLPIRIKFDTDETLLDLINKVKDSILNAYRYQYYPFDKLVEEIGIQTETNKNPFFDVMIAMQNTDNNDIFDFPNFTLYKSDYDYDVARFDLSINIYEQLSGLEIFIEYNTELFKYKTIDNIINKFEYLANIIFDSLDTKISDIGIIEEFEIDNIQKNINNNKTISPSHLKVNEIFESYAQSSPNAIALVTDKKTITYNELNILSNKLAYYIRDNYKIDQNNLIGLFSDRNEFMIIGILAILKAGTGYVPIDIDNPAERTEYILKDSKVNLVICDESNIDSVPDGYAKIVVTDEFLQKLEEKKDIISDNTSDDICYVIYTSGTTGNPKGVMNMHKNISRVVCNTNYISIKPKNHILSLSNYAFDGSIFNIFGALLNGATLRLVSEEELMNIEKLTKLISTTQNLIFFATTSLFNAIVDYDVNSLINVDKIVFGGEQASLQHVKKALAVVGPNKLINGYGPTETTVFACAKQINSILDTDSSISIGHPISNTNIYVVDNNNKLVPPGIKGELLIGGDGVALGYLNKPELTKEKFIKSPFKEDDILYRTGDIVIMDEDGEVNYIGRKDFQVKIRGFRVELGEIEAKLMEIEYINKAIVKFLKNKNENVLVGYVETMKKDIDKIDIANVLHQKLPDYMIPKYLIIMDNIYLNRNGKLDRSKLPEISEKDLLVRTQFVPAKTNLEKEMSNIWSEILNIKSIGIKDNFFDLGGHSLKAMQLLSRMNKLLNSNFTLKFLYEHPSINEIINAYKIFQNTNKRSKKAINTIVI
jgi:amino acid adenylation domain-containing protein